MLFDKRTIVLCAEIFSGAPKLPSITLARAPTLLCGWKHSIPPKERRRPRVQPVEELYTVTKITGSAPEPRIITAEAACENLKNEILCRIGARHATTSGALRVVTGYKHVGGS